MLKIFKSFTPQTIIVIMIFTIIIKSVYFFHPIDLKSIENIESLNWINRWIITQFGDSPLLSQALGCFLIITQALLVNRLCSEYKLFQQDTFIPASIYILLTSLSPWFNVISAQMISSTILLFLINNTLRLQTTSMPKKLMYNNGLFTGIAAVIYLPSLIILPFFVWSYAISKRLDVKEIIAFILGTLTLAYITISIGFLLDVSTYPILNAARLFQLPDLIFFNNHWIPMIWISILSAMGFISMSKSYSKSIESTKKMWLAISIFFICGATLPFVQWSNTMTNWHFLLIPGAMIISSIWMTDMNKWMKIGLFWITMSIIAYQQYSHFITQ